MKHPMQYTKDHRFVENKLISWMVERVGLNEIAREFSIEDYDNDDYDQLLQLIGYSVSGIPYKDKGKYDITNTDLKPEEVYENKYKNLKNRLKPIIRDYFNYEDLE